MNYSWGFFGGVVLTQLAIAFIRLGITSSKEAMARKFTLIAGAAVAALSIGLVNTIGIIGIILSQPGLLMFMAIAGLRDPHYPKHLHRKRALIIASPSILIVISAAFINQQIRTLFDHANYPVVALGTLAAMIGSYVAWGDYKNISGLNQDDGDTAEDNAYKAIQILEKEIDSVYSEKLISKPTDTYIWILVILQATSILFIILQMCLAKITPISESISFVPFLFLSLSAIIALLGAHQIKSRKSNFICSYLLQITPLILLTISLISAATNMSYYSDLSIKAMAYRVAIGTLIATLEAEDIIVSFFILNGLKPRIRDYMFALIAGCTYGICFIAAATISYYDDGSVRFNWLLLVGFLLIGMWLVSIVTVRSFASHISGPFMTLKTPNDIVLSDQTMFAGLTGGCVAGASLISNGQSPLVALVVLVLVGAFVGVCLQNDDTHLSNESDRLLNDQRWSDKERARHIRWLIWHLRIQEIIPIAAVGSSFLGATLFYWA